jgi:hypothetical protein
LTYDAILVISGFRPHAKAVTECIILYPDVGRANAYECIVIEVDEVVMAGVFVNIFP